MIYFLLIVGEVEIQVPNFAVGIWVDAGTCMKLMEEKSLNYLNLKKEEANEICTVLILCLPE